MSQIISHREWMKLTDGGALATRSPALKALDAALLAHEKKPDPAGKQALVSALHGWINAQGPGWKTSIRNRRNAIETLFRQLGPEGGQIKPNRVALSHAFHESEIFVADLFHGKKIVPRPGLMTKIAGNATLSKLAAGWAVFSVAKQSHALHKLTTPASAPGLASQLARMLADEIIPPEARVEAMQMLASLMPEFMANLSAACAPFVGVGISGVTSIVAAGKAAQAEYKVRTSMTHAARTLSAGDPEAAFQAVIRMLEREFNNNMAAAGVGYAAFGAKLVSLLVDGGAVTNTAISLTTALINLLMLARIVVRDVMERKEANKLLAQPVVTAALFAASPLMGAYLVCCAPTSVIVNTVIDYDTFARPGMMDKVERAVKTHIQPLKEVAQKLVKEHRMYIPELQKHAGIIEKNAGNLKKMAAATGKTAIGQKHIEG
jgi:hypothetical protein